MKDIISRLNVGSGDTSLNKYCEKIKRCNGDWIIYRLTKILYGVKPIPHPL